MAGVPFKAFVARLLVTLCGPFNSIDAYEGPKSPKPTSPKSPVVRPLILLEPKRRNPVDYEKPTIYRSCKFYGLWVCQSKDADAHGSTPEEAYRLWLNTYLDVVTARRYYPPPSRIVYC